MSYYDPNYFNNVQNNVVSNNVNGQLIWVIISFVLAVIAAVVLYLTVFDKTKDGKYNGFMSKLYDFVHFKYFIIDDLFKIFYLICAISITLVSLAYLGNYKFLLILLGGNLALRISYELLMLFIELCHNVRKISNKNKK